MRDKHLKKFFSKNNAFTMAEIMVVMTILSVVAIFAMRIAIFKKAKYENKYMCYSAYTNLKEGAAHLKAEGCTSTDVTNADCDNILYLPKKGFNTTTKRGLCDRLSDLYNTIGTVYCSTAATSITTQTSFSTLTPNFTTSNGMIFYNLGSDANTTTNLFDVYVDIDGKRRDGVLNVDVVRFTVNAQTGNVYPYYSLISKSATSTDYLSTSVGYRDNTTGVYKWLSSNVSFDKAFCAINGVHPGTTDTTSCTKDATCTTNACDINVNEPGFLFF
jgi:prepilin-type N-terminal cleavage/methylation domain-containing protein